jgi:hypothetical protein
MVMEDEEGKSPSDVEITDLEDDAIYEGSELKANIDEELQLPAIPQEVKFDTPVAKRIYITLREVWKESKQKRHTRESQTLNEES